MAEQVARQIFGQLGAALDVFLGIEMTNSRKS